MARSEFYQTITEFAEFVGMKDKEIVKLIGAMQSLTTSHRSIKR